MPLSTSNSDARAGRCLGFIGWSRFWLMVAAAVALLLGLWEGCWRMRGFQPSVTDSWQIWSLIRRQASETPRGVALVGASRILVGLDPDMLSDKLGRPVHMLAIDGSDPLPVFHHLAGDDDFRGSVILSLPPYWLAGRDPIGTERPRQWLELYSSQTLSSRVETRLALLLQSRLVFRYSGVSPRQLWEEWRQGDDITPPYAPMRPDRYRPADYSKTDLASLRRSRIARTREMHDEVNFLDADAFEERVAAIASAVERIRGRGGEVIFVRFPSCGEVLEIEEQTVPRERYWDVLSQTVPGPALHFKDYRGLSGFACMDGSHLDYSDARVFTANLAEIVEKQGMLE